MIDDETMNTMKWWVDYANKMERERDMWCERCMDAEMRYMQLVREEEA